MIKKYFKKIILVGITLTSLLTISPISAYASFGFSDINGNNNYQMSGDKCYYKNGNLVRNQWIRAWWYDDQYKIMLSNDWYYYKSDGSIAKGWNLIDGKWYYFRLSNDSDLCGAMYHDSFSPDGYYLGSDGALVEHPSGIYIGGNSGAVG